MYSNLKIMLFTLLLMPLLALVSCSEQGQIFRFSAVEKLQDPNDIKEVAITEVDFAHKLKELKMRYDSQSRDRMLLTVAAVGCGLSIAAFLIYRIKIAKFLALACLLVLAITAGLLWYGKWVALGAVIALAVGSTGALVLMIGSIFDSKGVQKQFVNTKRAFEDVVVGNELFKRAVDKDTVTEFENVQRNVQGDSVTKKLVMDVRKKELTL